MRQAIAALLLISSFGIASADLILVPDHAPTIQAGIDLAVAGDVVQVACGTYLEHDVQMKSGVTLRGETGEPGCVIIDGERLSYTMLCMECDGETLIEGITISRGLTPEGLNYGGGVYVEGGAPRFERCDFTLNEAYYRGAGVYCGYSSASFLDCRFYDNIEDDAGGGGGGMGLGFADVTIRSCEFRDNIGIDGAAIFSYHSDLFIEDCLFAGNDAPFWGGAIAVYAYSNAEIRNTTFVDNEAYQGGGIWVLHYSDATLTNCIIAHSTSGSGVYMDSEGDDISTVTFECCDLFQNVGGNYGGDLTDQTGIDGNISERPLFCDLAAGDYSLAADSPCLPANNGCGVRMGAYGEGCAGATAAPAAIAAHFELHQNSPNPFNPRTKISFTLAEAAAVDLTVFDTQGRRVKSLLAGDWRGAGSQETSWDGRDDAGRPLPSGVYHARLAAAGREAGITMILLK